MFAFDVNTLEFSGEYIVPVKLNGGETDDINGTALPNNALEYTKREEVDNFKGVEEFMETHRVEDDLDEEYNSE